MGCYADGESLARVSQVGSTRPEGMADPFCDDLKLEGRHQKAFLRRFYGTIAGTNKDPSDDRADIVVYLL
jgi:hypothetical protein